jgi:hypothetical protein
MKLEIKIALRCSPLRCAQRISGEKRSVGDQPLVIINRKHLQHRVHLFIGRRRETSMGPGQFTDAFFGTRAHTEGALYQLPRKIPLRIEPKTYFGESLPQGLSVCGCLERGSNSGAVQDLADIFFFLQQMNARFCHG